MKFKNLNISTLFFVLASTALFFSSCEKDDDLINSKVPSNNSLLSDLVILEDNDELLSVAKLLDEGFDPSEINQLDNFFSMWDAYEAIIESEGNEQEQLLKLYPNSISYSAEGELLPKVKDEALAKVLNPDGYLKIGERIIFVDDLHVKVIANGDKELLPQLETIQESNEEGTILVGKITDYKGSNFKNTADYTWSGTVYSGSKKRVKWEKWGRHYPFLYASIGAKIKYQEKKWLGWFAQKRSLFLHVVLDYACIGGCDHRIVGPLDFSDSKTARSITVSKHYPEGTVNPIYGLVIDFNANGIIATR